MKREINIDRLNIRLKGVSAAEARKVLARGNLDNAILRHLSHPAAPAAGLQDRVAKQVSEVVRHKMKGNGGGENA